MEIRFYHLERQSFEQALPGFLGKVLESGRKAVVRTIDKPAAEKLSEYLWTYGPASFLPHGTAEDEFPERQIVLLTPMLENPAAAEVLIVAPGAATEAYDGFSLCCEFLDGRDADSITAARTRWKIYKDANYTLTYWQQTPQGWEKKQG